MSFLNIIVSQVSHKRLPYVESFTKLCIPEKANKVKSRGFSLFRSQSKVAHDASFARTSKIDATGSFIRAIPKRLTPSNWNSSLYSYNLYNKLKESDRNNEQAPTKNKNKTTNRPCAATNKPQDLHNTRRIEPLPNCKSPHAIQELPSYFRATPTFGWGMEIRSRRLQ
jgi:hypothetical protein